RPSAKARSTSPYEEEGRRKEGELSHSAKRGGCAQHRKRALSALKREREEKMKEGAQRRDDQKNSRDAEAHCGAKARCPQGDVRDQQLRRRRAEEHSRGIEAQGAHGDDERAEDDERGEEEHHADEAFEPAKGTYLF